MQAGDRTTNEVPWGHRYRVSIYIEGEMTERIMQAMQSALDVLTDELATSAVPVAFMGAAVDPVANKPHDQIAT